MDIITLWINNAASRVILRGWGEKMTDSPAGTIDEDWSRYIEERP